MKCCQMVRKTNCKKNLIRGQFAKGHPKKKIPTQFSGLNVEIIAGDVFSVSLLVREYTNHNSENL